jgi:hypothetical protein
MDQEYVTLKIKNSEEYWQINSKKFRHWIVHKHFLETGKVPNSNGINQVIEYLSAKAFMEGKPIKLHMRVAEHDGNIYYDLANDKKQVIEIDADGWRTTRNPPVSFARYTNTAPQVLPSKKAVITDIYSIFDFINLKEEDQLLFLVELISCFVPDIPHVILSLYGEKGASKSTALRIKRRILDPAITELVSLPNDPEQLKLILARNYCPLFDNLDYLKGWQSDLLCTASTGGGNIKRQLYTDQDEVLLKFKCCVGLNGINTVGMRPDLLDRSLIFELDRIRPENRLSESDLWAMFEERRPYILGAIFTILSGALQVYPEIELESLPRMADFARWGYAIANALGDAGDDFLKALEDNDTRTNNEAILASPLAVAILLLMKDKQEWNGTATELLKELNEIALDESLDTQAKLWPKGANYISRRLKSIKANLESQGIYYEIHRNSQNVSDLTITKVILKDNNSYNENADWEDE